MPSDFFRSRQTQSFLNGFIKIVDYTEVKKIGGIFRNEVTGGVLKAQEGAIPASQLIDTV